MKLQAGEDSTVIRDHEYSNISFNVIERNRLLLEKQFLILFLTS